MLNKLNSIYSIKITIKIQLQSCTETPSFQGVAFLSNKRFGFCESYKTNVFVDLGTTLVATFKLQCIKLPKLRRFFYF